MNCIAVLTRGYETLDEYAMLIKRNQHIAVNLKVRNVDILIFHEGNIREEQQIHIQGQTPDLPLKFVDVSGVGFKPEKSTIPKESTDWFGLGYRHMCSFWFVDFWGLVGEYDTLLRIDEDCFVDFSIDDVFFGEGASSHLFIAGGTIEDCDFVTWGLNPFSLDFIGFTDFEEGSKSEIFRRCDAGASNENIDRNRTEYEFKGVGGRLPVGPCTNLMLFRLKQIREVPLFFKYVEEVDESEMIYRRRWGDLPLWGEAIYYIFGEDTFQIDTRIKYYHASHKAHVN